MAKKIKAYKVTISGSYKGHDHKVFDFRDIKGLIPFNRPDIAKQHLMRRIAPMWIFQDPIKYKERLTLIRTVDCHDELENCVVMVDSSTFSYIGKDIKEMTHEELQYLALANDLKEVPLFNKTSLKQTQEIAYVEYSKKVLGKFLDRKKEGFNFFKLKPLIVDAEVHQDNTKKITNEEIIEREQNITDASSSVDSSLTLDDLKEIADEKGIAYHSTIGRNALYKKLYGTSEQEVAA